MIRTVQNPLVSIVTPVHNGAEYLAECIESVVAQTYSDWTYTIVDNASTDATPEIADAFARSDARIRHLRFDEFVDATANHNRAFDAVSTDSEFCKVVQGDDWLFPECIRRMVEVAKQSETVGIVGAYQLREARVDLEGVRFDQTVVPGREVLRGMLLGLFNATGSPTATLLRTRFVHERRPFWRDGLRHQDTEALYWMLARHDFGFVHQVLTFSREQADSRYQWSAQVNSHEAEDIIFVLRYGREVVAGRPVLNEAEYRRRIRALLHSYLGWHARQIPRVARTGSEFFAFHREKQRQILAEGWDDREVRASMKALGLLLSRGALLRR